MSARVQIYVRQHCHLCEVAVATAREVCAQTGDSIELIDIDTDPALRARFTDEVPVTWVDGQQHDFWRLDPVRLRAALAAGRREGGV